MTVSANYYNKNSLNKDRITSKLKVFEHASRKQLIQVKKWWW